MAADCLMGANTLAAFSRSGRIRSGTCAERSDWALLWSACACSPCSSPVSHSRSATKVNGSSGRASANKLRAVLKAASSRLLLLAMYASLACRSTRATRAAATGSAGTSAGATRAERFPVRGRLLGLCEGVDHTRGMHVKPAHDNENWVRTFPFKCETVHADLMVSSIRMRPLLLGLSLIVQPRQYTGQGCRMLAYSPRTAPFVPEVSSTPTTQLMEENEPLPILPPALTAVSAQLRWPSVLGSADGSCDSFRAFTPLAYRPLA